MRFVKPQILKRFILTAAAALLIVLLAELLYYPLNPSRLAEDASAKTAGSIMVLTGETPQELRVYHRALLLPRYRVKSVGELPEEDCMTANEDWFQTFVISIENRQIVLYDLKYNARSLKMLVYFIWFAVLLDQTRVPVWQWAKRKKANQGHKGGDE